MPEQHRLPSDPGARAAGLSRLGAVPLRQSDPGQVGPYTTLAVLGSGGMGRIYLGRDSSAGHGLAAVKVIRPEYAEDPQFRLRFEREATALARVRGDHTALLLGTGLDGDLVWMATEYIPGLSLSAATAQGPVGASAAWRLAADLGLAIEAMAAVGVVHRDLKPSNVVLAADGARVIDFGIAQAAETSAITSTGQQVGTPAYMSPEQVRGEAVSAASDVFSLASTVACAVTGRAPFGDGTSVDVLHRVAYEPPKDDVLAAVAAADPDLAELIASCLDKDPERRPTPGEVVEAASTRQVPAPWPPAVGDAIFARVAACQEVEWQARQEGFLPQRGGPDDGYAPGDTPVRPVTPATQLRPAAQPPQTAPGPVQQPVPTPPP
ncbi:serine/threonine-protein kinase, partial [Streptacidiphilus griseoplanus]|uniref:serine/threonine-protein kinase n=1 Tax=Peterkaempfera griseoplana TaxID=66896 RepID=UPI0012FEC630